MGTYEFLIETSSKLPLALSEWKIPLSKKIASLGDVLVFDAFGVSHRKEASSYGVSDYLDTYAGHLLESEIINAKKLLSDQTRPLTTIISGAKISTKLTLIKKLILKYIIEI